MSENEEMAVLRMAQDYGGGLNFSAPRMPTKVRRIAKDLLTRGFLTGKISSASLSDAGRVALSKHPRG